MNSGVDAENTYEFIAGYVDAEMGKYDIITGKGEELSIFHTTHHNDKIENNSVYLRDLKRDDPEMKLVSMIHNHSVGNLETNGVASIYPSGRAPGATKGDVPQSIYLKNEVFRNQDPQPKFFIWNFGRKREY